MNLETNLSATTDLPEVNRSQLKMTKKIDFLSFSVLLDRKIQLFRPAGSLNQTFLLCQVMSLVFFILTIMPRGLWTFNFSLGEDFSL